MFYPNILKMDKSKLRLTIASPSQNLDTKSERFFHRFIPILVAENINRMAEYDSGKSLPRIDLWNCIGARMDESFNKQKQYVSRRDFSSALLEDKYIILNKLGISSEKRTIIRDDDSYTMSWFKDKLINLMSLGTIYLKKMDVDICSSCGYLKALSKMHDGNCTRCNGENFHQEKRKVLMLDLPKDINSLNSTHIVYPKNIKSIRNQFNQLPPKMMISKMRDYGLSLDFFDLPNYVLDPKIGVSLMPELLSEITHLKEITFVQGASIATNNIPYSSILSRKLDNDYVLLPKIPKMALENAENLGIGFVGRYLPLILMEHNKNMTASQLENAQQNYSLMRNKANNLLSGFQSREGLGLYFDSEEIQIVSEILKDFGKYKMHEGRKKLNLFFKYQRRKYSEKKKFNKENPKPSSSKKLEDLVSLFYL
jgi:hypothetical protein